MGKFLNIILFSLVLVISSYAQEEITLDLKLRQNKLPYGLSHLRSNYSPKMSLALSGGGARGISQLGVLKALEEFDVNIDKIVGTSMGSIIGGLYVSGYSTDELDSIITSAPWVEFFSFEETKRNELFVDQKITEDKALLTLRLDGLKPVIPTAINTGQRVSNFLNLLTLNAPIRPAETFDDLMIPFRAVSTNLLNGDKVVIKDGSLSLAMRASSSVSLVLEPVRKDSMLLVDGGIVANIPVITAKENTDFVIAVNAASPLRTEDELNYPWEIADQLVSIPMKKINDEQLEAADIVVEPFLQGKKNNDFTSLPVLIEEGYNATIKQIETIKNANKNIFFENIEIEEREFKIVSITSNSKNLESYLRKNISFNSVVSNKEIIYLLNNYKRLDDFQKIIPRVVVHSSSAELVVDVEENASINKVEILGATLIDNYELYKIKNKLLNQPYNSKKVLDVLLTILERYREKGYSLITIEDVAFDITAQTLTIRLEEGKIDQIRVVGNDKSYYKVVARELPLNEGDYFVNSKIEQGLVNLRSSGLFETIELLLNKVNGRNVVIIKVTEKPSQLLRLGLRIDNEYFTQLSLDIRDENFLGSATEVGAIFTGGLKNNSVVLEHQADRIFDTYLTYNIKGFYNQRDINTYTDSPDNSERIFKRIRSGEYIQSSFGGSIGIGSQIEKFGNIMIEGKYQHDKIRNKEDFPSENTYGTDIAGLKIILAIDSQNKFPYPDKGFLVNSYYETAQSYLGGEVSYAKFYINYNSYLPLSNRDNLAARFTLGFADETLPLSQQFSFGGQNNFFGYREYSYRGRQIFISSLEYRILLPIQVFFDTYFKMRYDLGSIWSEQEAIRFKDLRHGIGATLSVDTPIGPADFSVGKSFMIKNKLPENILSWGETFLYFTIGYYY